MPTNLSRQLKSNRNGKRRAAMKKKKSAETLSVEHRNPGTFWRPEWEWVVTGFRDGKIILQRQKASEDVLRSVDVVQNGKKENLYDLLKRKEAERRMTGAVEKF
jgi:hypothetical protein